MWPSWQFALQFALVIFAVVGALALTRPLIPRTRGPLALAIEVGRMFLLYALWQFTKERTVTRQAGAVENARSLWHLEQWLHLPSELALQRAFTPHRWLISMMNAYYGIAHVPVMGGVLVWLYWRHRDRYPTVRNVLFATTLVSVLLHMRPLAPPRMMTDLGFIDSALLMHQSVYGGGGGVSNEVAALPSLHYAWAIIAAIAVVRFSTSRWRWLILIHPILTALSVTSTANHWWLDGVLAGVIIAVVWPIYVALRLRWACTRLSSSNDDHGERDEGVAEVLSTTHKVLKSL